MPTLLLERILSNLTEAVTVTDRRRRMVYANQAAADLLGHATPEELMAQLARRAAAAVENARLYTERTQAAHTLQQSLLPERLPSVPGWELASSYAAGDTTADVGGDFYDVIALDAGLLAIVGDVTGKGVQAAALTSLARYTLATAARFDASPPAVVGLLNEVLVARTDLSLVTVACGHFVPTPTGAIMRLTSAGHPSPVLVRAGREAVAVGAPGLLLGMLGEAQWDEVGVELAPGDAVLFYTDGVTDTPSDRDRFGVEHLLTAVSGETVDPAGVIQRVQRALRAFQVGDVVDDRAMLALQLVTVSSAASAGAGAREPESSVL